MFKRNFRELMVPAILLLVFFVIETFMGNAEAYLTLLFAFFIGIIFLSWSNRNEGKIFFLGFTVGTLIEVGFRFFGSQQYWTHASFFGVPYWLPLCWGILPVFITRIGIYIRNFKI